MSKAKGRDNLAAAGWLPHRDGKESYDVVGASAHHVYGPYGPRYEAVRYGGRSGSFHDAKGQWYAAV